MSGRLGRVIGFLSAGMLLVACYGCLSRQLSAWQALATAGAAACCVVMWTIVTVSRGLRERGPAQATATAYLDAVVAAQFPVAYELLTEQRRQEVDLSEFSGSYAGDQQLAGYSIEGTTIVGPGGPHAEVRGLARFATGEVALLQLLLIRQDDGRWWVSNWHTDHRWNSG